jgi:hypothetical protein
MNVFDLFAKLTLDTSDFDKQVTDASKSFDKLGGAAEDIPGDTQKAEKAVDKFTRSVEEATTETNQAETALNDAERSLRDVGKEADKASPPIEDAADGLKNVGETSGGADGALSGLGKTITGAVTKGHLLAAAIEVAVSTIKSFAEAVWNMDESTEEFRVSMGKLDTAFETMGYSTTSARKTFREFYKLLGDTGTAVEASQLLARLTTSTKEQARWTEIAAGVYGTFGDSLPIEGLIEASNETAKVGQVTGVLADALNWVGISEDDFNIRLASCADTAERTALITDTLAAAYDDAAAAMYRNNSAVMNARDAQLELEEAQAGVGEQISRLKTAFSGILTPSIAKVLGWVEKLTSGFADVAERWAEAADEFRNPLPTESVEDARAQLEAWNDELVRLKAELAGVSEATDADTFWRLSYQVDDLTGKISRGTEQLADMEAAEASAAETANVTADAVDKMTISANGFSVELSGSSLALEEATERLNTYTDAATNMFSRINTESELSYQQMLDNLRHNIDATNNFADNMASIAGELPAEIAEMFYAGGPEVYAGIVATLAAANEGGEEGLAEMRAMWQEGGEAAKDAFLQSVGAVDVTENPGTKMAEAMDSDVSAEQAGQNLVNRTAIAVSDQVNVASFYVSGIAAVDRFIAGLSSRSEAARRAGESISNAAAAGMSSGGTGGHSSAGGLDYVPYDGYPAVLHRGESVLTKAEAEDWRRGTHNAAGITIVQNIQSVPQTPVELAAATAAYFETARWAM